MVRQKSSLLSKYTYLPTPPPSTTKQYRRSSLNDKYDRTVGRIGGRLNNGLWNRLKQKAELEEREDERVSMGEIFGEEVGEDDEPVWQGARDARENIPRNRHLSGVVDRGAYKPETQASVDRILDDIIFKQHGSSSPNDSDPPPHHSSSHFAPYEQSPEGSNVVFSNRNALPRYSDSSNMQAGQALDHDDYERQPHAGPAQTMAVETGRSDRPFNERMKEYREGKRAATEPKLTDSLPLRGTLAPPHQAQPQALQIMPDESSIAPLALAYPHYPYHYFQSPFQQYNLPYPYAPPGLHTYHYPQPHHLHPNAPPHGDWRSQANMTIPNIPPPWKYQQIPYPYVSEYTSKQVSSEPRPDDIAPLDTHLDLRIPTPLKRAHQGLLHPQAKKLQRREVLQPANGKRKGKAFVKALEACVEDEGDVDSGGESDELRLKTPKRMPDGSYAPAEWDVVPGHGSFQPSSAMNDSTADTTQHAQSTHVPLPTRRQLPVPSKRMRDLQEHPRHEGAQVMNVRGQLSLDDADQDLQDEVQDGLEDDSNNDAYSEQSGENTVYEDEEPSLPEQDNHRQEGPEKEYTEEYYLEEAARSLSPSPAPRVMKVSEAAWNFALPPTISAQAALKTKPMKPKRSIKQSHRKPIQIQVSPTQRRTASGGIVSSLKKPKVEVVEQSAQGPTRRVSWVATQESIGDFSDVGSMDVDELDSFPMDGDGRLDGTRRDVDEQRPEEGDEDGETEFGIFGEGFFDKDAGDVGFAVWRDGY